MTAAVVARRARGRVPVRPPAAARLADARADPGAADGHDRVGAAASSTSRSAGGEAVALVGRSGGGKTTLLRTIAGVLAPDAGTIRVDGRVGALLSVGAA